MESLQRALRVGREAWLNSGAMMLMLHERLHLQRFCLAGTSGFHALTRINLLIRTCAVRLPAWRLTTTPPYRGGKLRPRLLASVPEDIPASPDFAVSSVESLLIGSLASASSTNRLFYVLTNTELRTPTLQSDVRHMV